MIVLDRKEDCCGCHACESVCPTRCISMREDSEGFLYPETDLSKCIDCHLCEKVCPVINSPIRTGINLPLSKDFLEEPPVFAAQCASDELRMASASGGAFTLLAERTIKNGGVVFGSRWNDDFTEAFHDFTETIEGLAAFRGSKYLQSRIGDTFRKAQEFLRAGREVMFTGTPCQIAGLKRALRRDYPNLLAVDIACHSAPSPKVWKAFFQNLRETKKLGEIREVSFRKKLFNKKRKAWDCTRFFVQGTDGCYEDSAYGMSYGIGFINGLWGRPSCHECPAKDRTSGSDITIGDFWGVEKYYPNLKFGNGLSVVVCNTARGEDSLKSVSSKFGILQKATYLQAAPHNDGLKSKMSKNPKRDAFFAEFNVARDVEAAVATMRKFTRIPLKKRVRNFIVRCVRFLLHRTGTLSFAKKILKR